MEYIEPINLEDVQNAEVDWFWRMWKVDVAIKASIAIS